jgi:hypothetical protein
MAALEKEKNCTEGLLSRCVFAIICWRYKKFSEAWNPPLPLLLVTTIRISPITHNRDDLFGGAMIDE